MVKSLIEADAKGEFEYAFVFFGVEDLRSEFKAYCSESGIPFRFVRKKRGTDLNAWRRIAQALDELKPEILILHSTSMAPAIVRWKRNGTRLILVEHTPNATKSKQENLGTVLLAPLVHRIVHLNEGYWKDYPSSVRTLVKKKKIHVIPNGVDVERFKQKSSNYGHDTELTICMVGRFSQQKDQASLVRCVREMPDQSIRLYLAGEGETLENVRQLADGDPRIHFPGDLAETQVIELLRSAHLYVHSSKSETLSTSVLQALSCGLPCLVSKIPGNEIFLRNRMASPFSSIQELKVLIQDFMDNPKKWEVEATEASTYTRREFSSARMLQAYRQLMLSNS